MPHKKEQHEQIGGKGAHKLMVKLTPSKELEQLQHDTRQQSLSNAV